jgi:hypothetical protein
LATPIFTAGQVQQQSRDRLGVLELADSLVDLRDVPVHELELLVLLGLRDPCLDTFCDEDVHALPAKAGRRVETAELAPRAARQAGLLLQLAPRALERRLAFFERAGG